MDKRTTEEHVIAVQSGWMMLPTCLGLLLAGVTFFILGLALVEDHAARGLPMALAGPLIFVLSIILLAGHFVLQPNEARVLLLFGDYKGTVRESGFHWTNPFMSKLRISLRTRNLETQRLKVNDKQGNPIEIAAVVVWHV